MLKVVRNRILYTIKVIQISLSKIRKINKFWTHEKVRPLIIFKR